LRKRPDWSRKLPHAIDIPEIMTVRTLADVRKLLGHMPKQYRDKATWQYVAKCLTEAASDGDTENVAVPLKMVLSLEGIAYQTTRVGAAD